MIQLLRKCVKIYIKFLYKYYINGVRKIQREY